MLKNLMLIITILTYSSFASASFIASNKDRIDPKLPTHVLVAGAPDELGELFIYSLLTRAKIYLEKSPSEQIIIIGRNEDKQYIRDAGFKIITSKFGLLKSDTIKLGIANIKYLNSMDIYAHSNPITGALLDIGTITFQILNEKDDLWDEVKNKTDQSSFIFIHGCNAGIKFAPLLAKKLRIAVFAALTSTDFQFIYKNNLWSSENKNEGLKKSDKNTLNYSTAKSCGIYCTRMKPDNNSYKGHWGDWSAGGYPTYKLFCGNNNNENCELGALEAIFSFPSIYKYKDIKLNLENFNNQLIEIMCPNESSTENREECRSNLLQLTNSNQTSNYSPFQGKTLNCDRGECKAHFNCSAMKAAFKPWLCELVSETDELSTTFTDEYQYFISIYKKNFTEKNLNP